MYLNASSVLSLTPAVAILGLFGTQIPPPDFELVPPH